MTDRFDLSLWTQFTRALRKFERIRVREIVSHVSIPQDNLKYAQLAKFIGNNDLNIDLRFGDRGDVVKGLAKQIAEAVRGGRPDIVAVMCAWLWIDHHKKGRELFKDIGIIEQIDAVFNQDGSLRRKPSIITGTSDALVTSGSDVEQFELPSLIAAATQSVVLIAQNHWLLTGAGGREDFWPQLRDALARGITIDIVAMHDQVPPSGRSINDVPSAVDLWSHYMAPHGPFIEHLQKTWTKFERWYRAYLDMTDQRPSVGRFTVWGAYFVPISMTLIDHRTSDGMLVMSPRTFSVTAGDRPQFILRRSEAPGPFQYYVSYFDAGRGSGGWREIYNEEDSPTSDWPLIVSRNAKQ